MSKQPEYKYIQYTFMCTKCRSILHHNLSWECSCPENKVSLNLSGSIEDFLVTDKEKKEVGYTEAIEANSKLLDTSKKAVPVHIQSNEQPINYYDRVVFLYGMNHRLTYGMLHTFESRVLLTIAGSRSLRSSIRKAAAIEIRKREGRRISPRYGKEENTSSVTDLYYDE